MMDLTAKQEAFAQAVVGGLNQSDAYRSAYNAGKMKPETIQSKASLLMKKGMVGARVDDLRKELADKSLWTREQSMQTMVDVICEGGSKATDKINAVKVLNEMQGFNAPIKSETTMHLPKTINVISGRA